MTNTPVYGLVCAGGGAHGAYQVGVLKYIHEHFCNGTAGPFRVFSGTSAGSLNERARTSPIWYAGVEVKKGGDGAHVTPHAGHIPLVPKKN